MLFLLGRGFRRAGILAKLAGAVMGLALSGSLAGCGRSHDGSRDGSGSLQLEGSSSMEKLVDALAEGFMARYPDVTVNVQFTGSGAGIEAVADKRADIGDSSRNLTEAEKEQGLVEHLVGLDGIAVCVDSGNAVRDITSRELAEIYTGQITHWSSLGGGNLPIVVIGREAGSGTREAFESLLGIEEQCTYANELDSTGAVMARVASTPGAIGYVSFDVMGTAAGRNATALALDGIRADTVNVGNGTYPLSRPFLMVTRGELSAQNELVQSWFRYVYSPEGREIAAKAGLAWEPE